MIRRTAGFDLDYSVMVERRIWDIFGLNVGC